MPDERLELAVGQWVTCEAPDGRKVSGRVAKVDKDEHHGITTYTVHQYPEFGPMMTRAWDADWNEVT